MKNHTIKYGEEYTVSGYFSKYTADISHSKLNERKIIKDKEQSALNVKIENQFKRWDLKYAKIEGKKFAEEATEKAEQESLYVRNILKNYMVENIVLKLKVTISRLGKT